MRKVLLELARLRILRAGATLLGTLLLACASPATPPARHVVLVTLDTTRADRLGAYGRASAGTPWLDALAEGGTRVERAYTAVPITLPAHVTLLTGLIPPHTGIHVNGQTALAPGVRTLPEILGEAGFFTAASIGGYPLAGRFPTRRGFEAFDDRLDASSDGVPLERDAGAVVAAALELLGSRGNRRTFLWVHLFDPHDPYAPPSPFRERFPDDPYQGEISRMDSALAELGARLRQALDGETVLICVVGDHGEALGEHGEDTHGFFVYEPTMRVPLILAGPRVPQGRVISGPIATADLAPTLLSLLDVPATVKFDGVEIDLETPGATTRRLYVETDLPGLHYGFASLRGCIDGFWKYVRAPRPEIYDLREDPGESHNVYAERGEEAQQLESWIGEMLGNRPDRVLAPPPPDSRLTSLGYVGTGGSPRAGGALDPKDGLGIYRKFQEASRALEAGQPRQALPLLDALLREADTPGTRFKRAVALRMSGREDEAEGELRRVASSSPSFPGLLLEQCRVAVARHDWQVALDAARRHLETEPDDPRALVLRGAAWENLGHADAAERDYRQALAGSPTFRDASLRLARLLVLGGRTEDARSVLRAHLAMHPSDELARGLLGAL